MYIRKSKAFFKIYLATLLHYFINFVYRLNNSHWDKYSEDFLHIWFEDKILNMTVN